MCRLLIERRVYPYATATARTRRRRRSPSCSRPGSGRRLRDVAPRAERARAERAFHEDPLQEPAVIDDAEPGAAGDAEQRIRGAEQAVQSVDEPERHCVLALAPALVPTQDTALRDRVHAA